MRYSEFVEVTRKSNKRGGCTATSFFQKLYNKRDFQAFEGRETAVYWSVNEDFETEYNAEITLLDSFSHSTCVP